MAAVGSATVNGAARAVSSKGRSMRGLREIP
jgi:hypothetical protein